MTYLAANLRPQSIAASYRCGGHGTMTPELIALMLEAHAERQGYNETEDTFDYDEEDDNA